MTYAISTSWSTTDDIANDTSCYDYAGSRRIDHESLDIPLLEPRCEVLSSLLAGLPSTSAVCNRRRNSAGYDLTLGEVAGVETGGQSDYSYQGVSKYVSFHFSSRRSS